MVMVMNKIITNTIMTLFLNPFTPWAAHRQQRQPPTQPNEWDNQLSLLRRRPRQGLYPVEKKREKNN